MISDRSGAVVWLTGRPAAGKSTLAREVGRELRARAELCCVLDGDDVRASLHPRPGYGPDDRAAFYATLSDLAALLATQGLIVLVAATAHRRAFRDQARQKAPRFLEVLVHCDEAQCEKRDPKGLYEKARTGAIDGLPSASLYEEPERPDLVVDTTRATPTDGSAAVVQLVARQHSRGASLL